MSVKVHVLKKAYVVKFYSGIHRYFAKQRKIGTFYLVEESRILPYCFCEQPYQYLMPVYSCSSQWLLWISSKIFAWKSDLLIIHERLECCDSKLESNNHTLSHVSRQLFPWNFGKAIPRNNWLLCQIFLSEKYVYRSAHLLYFTFT